VAGDVGFGELGGDADGVEDGEVVGGAVADDAGAADAEEGGAAVFGVVEAAFEVFEGFAAEEGADLGGDGGLEGLFEGVGDEAGEAFGGFEGDVADEAVADDDVDGAVEEVAAFDVAAEAVEVGAVEGAEEGEGFAGEGVALAVLFTDGEEAGAGFGDAKDVAGVDLAHEGELDEVCGVGVDVGTDVEQGAGEAGSGGEDGGEGGAVDAFEGAEDHFGGGHGGTGVAGGDEAVGVAFADEPEADAHGAVFFGADGGGGLVGHADPLGGMDDVDGEVFAVAVEVECWADAVFGADEVDADGELAACGHGTANLGVRGFVGAHGVEDDVGQHAVCVWMSLVPGLDFRFGGEDGAALVLAALGAGVMGELALLAVGADVAVWEGEEVVGAAFGGALLGVAALGIRHGETLSTQPVPAHAGNT